MYSVLLNRAFVCLFFLIMIDLLVMYSILVRDVVFWVKTEVFPF